MRNLKVDLGERSYYIHIGRGVATNSSLWQPLLAGRGVFVLSDENVAPAHLPSLLQVLPQDNVSTMVLPAGEHNKTLATVEEVSRRMLQAHCDRESLLIALGGGVTGDIGGFVAACYQRGIDFCQVPTTLLAQVDSSVGGKTGVNLPEAKNIVGAFHQPLAVLADMAFLDTLPPREWSAGMAEVIKYGLIRDADFFTWLEENIVAINKKDQQALQQMVAVSCSNKAAVVAADEKEAGNRALLNLGHTFGHAIEAITGYASVLHGEAVAMGMNMAMDLSQRHGWLDSDSVERARKLIQAAGLPLQPPPGLTPEKMLQAMASDKKIKAGQLRLILLHGIGQAAIHDDYSKDLLRQTLEYFCNPQD